MPTLNRSQLFQLSQKILTGAGVSIEDAAVVAEELAEANIVGHDSHGVMRLVQYVQMMHEGFVKPGAPTEVVTDSPAFAILDGHFNFGQVVAKKALDIGMEKACACGTATVMIRNCNHVGRLGSYTHKAAKEGFAAMMAVNAPGPGGVAPFGGIDRRLGTNPISMSAPAANDALVLDMTTSATAEGKLRVSHQKGELVGEGLLIDGHGNASTNPGDYYAKPFGAILPLGGALMGHKGFGLAVMIDVFCGMLSGSGVCRDDLPRGANGVWLYLIDIERFIPRPDFDCLMDKYVASIKSARKLPGVSEILLPGEIEGRRAKERAAAGVSIPDETWRQINETATKLGVSIDGL
jgi:uncharacterized oxidoreductase